MPTLEELITNDSNSKQRRNLLVTALLLIAIKEQWISFEKNLVIFGGLNISPDVLTVTIPILFFYCYWRFWSHNSLHSSLSKFSGAAGNNYVHRLTYLYLKNIGSQILKKPVDEVHPELSSRFSTLAVIKSGPHYEELSHEQKVLMFKYNATWKRDDSQKEPHYHLLVKVPQDRVIYLWIFSSMRTFISESTFSEYLFPHIIAIVAVVEFVSRSEIASQFLGALRSSFYPYWAC